MKTIKEKVLSLFNYADELAEKGYEEIAKRLEFDVDELMHMLNCQKECPVDGIVKWQKDRLLDKQEYNYANEFVNILEELMESVGIKVTKDTRTFIMQDFIEFIFYIEEKYELDKVSPSKEDMVDAYFDICTFAVGAILKLGFNPRCVFEEGLKHISSRSGTIIDGKFQKDTSPEAKAKWHEASYEHCKKDNK